VLRTKAASRHRRGTVLSLPSTAHSI
jgi:hypothetical protein